MAEFYRSLKHLIRKRYGTQKGLAIERGVSESAVSQMVRRAASPNGFNPKTLGEYLALFPKPQDKDMLYESWRRSRAPSPLEMAAPDVDASDDEIIEFAVSVHDYADAGRNREAARILLKIWHRLAAAPQRQAVAFTIGRQLADCYSNLDRRHEAMQVISQLRKIANQLDNRSANAEALWLQAVIQRTIDPAKPENASAAFESLENLIHSWEQVQPKDKSLRRWRHAFLRDNVMRWWDRYETSGVDAEASFKQSIAKLDQSLQKGDFSSEAAVSEHVLARAFVGLGELEKADKRLDRATKLADSDAHLLFVMIQLTRLRLLIAAGEIESSQKLFVKLYEQTDRRDFVLYHNVLTTLLPLVFVD